MKKYKNNISPYKNNKTNLPLKSNDSQSRITIFRGNIVDNMNFGHKDDELSGYVKREIIVQDCNGNKQIAREVQFYNSGKKLNVEINNKRKS